MNITQIKINPTPEGGRMKAVVSVTFDNQLVVHDMRVIDGPERMFLAMPSRKMPDGSFRDIAHPITPELRSLLEGEVLTKYQSMDTKEPAAPQDDAAKTD